MTRGQLVTIILKSHDPMPISLRLTDVRGLGANGIDNMTERVRRWLILLSIASSLRDVRLRNAVIDMLRHQPMYMVEMFLARLVEDAQ